MSATPSPRHRAVVFATLKQHAVEGIARISLIDLRDETGFTEVTVLSHLKRMGESGTIEIIRPPHGANAYRIMVDGLNETTTWTPERIALMDERFPCEWNDPLLLMLNDLSGSPVTASMLKAYARDRGMRKDRARMPRNPNFFTKKPIVAKPVVEKPVVEPPTKREPVREHVYAVPRRSVMSIRGMPKLVVGTATARVEGVCSWPLTCGNEARGAYCDEHAAMVRR